MSNTLIVSGERSFYVSEVNGTNENEHANYLAQTTLASPHGPMDFYVVFNDAIPTTPLCGRFFLSRANAKQLFDAVQTNIGQYRNPLINGGTLEETQEWLNALTPWHYRRIVHPTDYGQDVVYQEYAGVQVVGERDSFELLGLNKGDGELPSYNEKHDDYFCIQVDLTEHQDENVKAFLYIKDRDNLVAVMDKLLDTWINVEVVVNSIERLKTLMGMPVDQN